MFYDRYVELCKSIGKTPTGVALELGLSKATPTKWKKSGATPHAEALKKIADYFGVTVSDLLGEEKEPTSEEIGSNKKALLEAVDGLSDEDTALVLAMIKAVKEQRK